MDEIMSSFMSLGMCGVVAGVLFKKFIEDSSSDKEYFRNEIKESREVFQEELRKQREESQKDREIYIESIEKITGRIDVIESDIKDIKEKINK